jgi:hypothetical protein
MRGGVDSNGSSNAQRCETPLRCVHVAYETTRDVVGLGNPIERCLARTGRCNGRWDGGKLEMTQEARDDRLLGHGDNNAERATSAKGTGALIQIKHGMRACVPWGVTAPKPLAFPDAQSALWPPCPCLLPRVTPGGPPLRHPAAYVQAAAPLDALRQGAPAGALGCSRGRAPERQRKRPLGVPSRHEKHFDRSVPCRW